MLSIIVAMDKNRLIGRGNDLPWHYPEDLAYFKKVTMGKSVLMGYNTYLSIFNRLHKALPGRTNYVLTSKQTLPGEGIIVKNLTEFLENKKHEEVFIIGGRSVYEQLINRADRLYITWIHQTFSGDTYFPEFDLQDFQLIQTDVTPNCTFSVYERKQK
ncbi:MAG TPA: dihydrofolate reductase [Bacilli bacterium]|jgi:dihydrofolate reductase|nr:dihydrofolate reductase [Acholeplasmataceae bacterium]OQB61178.1 MAG: Dihydrofolate reductase [Tenericutes bacterium ADurb.Bin140]HOE78197.1 dihydrofolate reductase [Bacilli bacterium]HON63964.1 dihydrofolate reductase [Bacilli bacterium]HOR96434.1 dihydrofolate reductase [Bacilli bacterium]